MSQLLLELHAWLGDTGFIAAIGTISVLLSVLVIPRTTDMMVNAAAGLTGKHLGRQHRTLVINCSTNNPELVTMLVAFFFGQLGGIGTPLGSNFANIYLMFGIALGYTLVMFRVRDPAAFRALIALLAKEKRLVGWHLLMSGAMFVIACIAFRGLTGQFPIGIGNKQHVAPGIEKILTAALLCLVGVALFVWRDAALRGERPELYEEIDSSDHVPSWTVLFLGTLGLVAGCYLINLIFAVTTSLYKGQLVAKLGPAVFAVLHYFVGALVTSLPELNVAIKNYRRVTSPDLNTALASATASNMTNLAIAGLGCLIAAILLTLGIPLES